MGVLDAQEVLLLFLAADRLEADRADRFEAPVLGQSMGETPLILMRGLH